MKNGDPCNSTHATGENFSQLDMKREAGSVQAIELCAVSRLVRDAEQSSRRQAK
jgi:hypothetical protein